MFSANCAAAYVSIFCRTLKIEKNRKGGAAAQSAVLYRELDSAQQRPLFNNPNRRGRIAVWKGSSFEQYSPHGVELAGYGTRSAIEGFLSDKYAKFKLCFEGYLKGRVAFRRISRGTDSRTTIAVLVPPRTPLTDAVACVAFGSRGSEEESWDTLTRTGVLGIYNSTPFDWLARRYVETTFNHFIMYGLTFPLLDNTPWERIGKLSARLSCVDERFADFATEAGVEWGEVTPMQRSDMRAEIDALVAQAYDLTTDELRFIFTDFTENAVPQTYRDMVLEKFEGL